MTEGMTEDTDGSLLSLSSLKERFQQIRKSARFTAKVKRPGRLVEVHKKCSYCLVPSVDLYSLQHLLLNSILRFPSTTKIQVI